MESMLDFLKRRLRDAGSHRWEAIAAAAGVAKTIPRKLAYGDRKNPRLGTVQPLVDYFNDIDAGRRELPPIVDVPHPVRPEVPAAVAFTSLPAAVQRRQLAGES